MTKCSEDGDALHTNVGRIFNLKINRLPTFTLVASAVTAVPVLWVLVSFWRRDAVYVETAPIAEVPGESSLVYSKWLMEDLLTIGTLKFGLPGILALALSMTPMVEAMPRILTEASVGKLPLLPYSAIFASGTMWFVYGLLTDSPVVWCPNAVNIILGVVYMAIFWRYCPPCANWLPLSRMHHLAFCMAAALASPGMSLLPAKLAMNLLGTIASAVTVVMFAGPLAAIRTVLTDRSTKSLPFGFTCVVTCNCLLWSGYGLLMACDPYIYVPNFLGFSVACVQLSLFARFGFSHGRDHGDSDDLRVIAPT